MVLSLFVLTSPNGLGKPSSISDNDTLSKGESHTALDVSIPLSLHPGYAPIQISDPFSFFVKFEEGSHFSVGPGR